MPVRYRNRSPFGALPRRYDRRGALWVPLTFWERLFNATGTDSPSFCWFRDPLFETVDMSGNLSDASCAWATGHDLTQSTPARRPFVNTVTNRWDFDRSNSESMSADFSTPIASGDHTLLMGLKFSDLTDWLNVVDWQTGRLSIITWNDDTTKYYINAQYGTVPQTADDQYLAYCLKNPNQASTRKNGIEIDNTLNYSSRALGGSAALGGNYLGNDCLKGSIAFLCGYFGYDASKIAEKEAIAAEIMVL